MDSEARYQLLRDNSGDEKRRDLDSGQPRSRHRRSRLALLACLLPVALLSLWFTCKPTTDNTPSGIIVSDDDNNTETVARCPSGLPLPAFAPAPVNLWAPLEIKEVVQIRKWLEDPERNLNLTQMSLAHPSDNIIFNIEKYYPDKADALAYLESPSISTATIPSRYARVTIEHGGWAKPTVKDYLVGPLPVDEKTELRELTDIYHRDDIPYNARGFANIQELSILLGQVVRPMATAMQDLFGASASGLPNDTLTVGASAPFSTDGEFRRMWISWKRNTGGSYLQPVGFWNYIDISGSDPALWGIRKVVYNHQVFNSTKAFLDAYNDGTLKRQSPRHDNGTDVSWSTRKRLGKQRDLDHLPGPRSVSFAGLRFRVDRKLGYLSWMGWGFYLGFDRDMGLSLWDIRMRSERIIYQLAPQEALAQYAGNDPVQSSTAWQDRFFGMGTAVRDMLPGYDCPYEAVFLPATTHSAEGSITRDHAICVFEQDTGRPLTRHTGFDEGEFGAARAYTFTVRSISTVGNYDYLFDYVFHLDGTIEIRVSASGYLQGAYYEPTQDAYGTRIRDTNMGSVHDHVINFKVDLDVAGVKNSLLHTSTSQEEVTQPWFDEDWGQTVVQQKITRKIIRNENDALLKYAANFQGGYAIINSDKLNKWGVPRGYSIHPGLSPIHNTVVGSRRLQNNANWARYNLAVSLRKDKEPSSSSMWNMNTPQRPIVDFHKFFDGDNITQEDLVAWVNIGTHHLPSAEDTPNTRTNTATSSFFLTPLNYFDHDISIDSTNAVLLTAPKQMGAPFKFDDYEVEPQHCVPEMPPPFEYLGISSHAGDGIAAPTSFEELRGNAELYHRIPLEA